MDDLGKASLVGRKLAHYRISTLIGAGGMGEVYRATDTKLGREVALKVLSSDMAGDPDRLARFQREARAVAALNHPNVVTVYSVEEANNVHFITMELIDGQPLDRLISTVGLPVDRIIEIANALAEALAAAHEKGILHRDLKPANVMVTGEGRVKVLDFGLAKDVSAESSTDATLTSAGHTQAGIVMGTPAYMSPEQVSGRTLDHRTDIFSLGVMLYEMTTGRRPFLGTSSAELVSSILRDSPPSVTEVRPELPADIGRVIRRCLEKDPRHRVQTARDVSNEFRDLARTTTRPTPVSTPHTRTAGAADSSAAHAALREDEGFWVAVLPFQYSGANADLVALAEGLLEEVITGLSRFSYLRVISRSSTARYAGQSVDVRRAGKELNARYVIEGTVRQGGSRLRLAVQLVDTNSGAHLWAENFERSFRPDAVFELQDDLVPRIVSTVADINGVLPCSMSGDLRSRLPGQLSPYEAVLRSFGYFDRVTAEELSAAMAGIKSAVEKAPTYADAWAMLALLSVQRYAQGFEPEADALTRGAEAARKAVEAAPANHLAWFSLSQVLFFQKEFRTFRNAAERALALNPMDSNSLAFHAEMLAYSGEWERGLSLAERARQLNPHHPAWYWHVNFNHAYRQRDYRAALEIASKMNQTRNWGAQALTAAAFGQLGDRDGAATALRELLQIRPDAAAKIRADVAKWFDNEYAAHLLEGLRKAGLEIPGAGVTAQVSSGSSRARTESGQTRADEGFWVAVLPLKYTGSNADLKALADGLSEEIVTGLSRFSYLRVIARGSTAKYSNESGDVRAIGKELGARYVMEGSVRQAGARVRVMVQLSDAGGGVQLWAETYERPFDSEAVFSLQDDLVPRIVSTVADSYGVLPHTMSLAVRRKDPTLLTPYEALLRSFSYAERVTAEEHIAAKDALKRAVGQSPNSSDCWAMLSILQTDGNIHGLDPAPDSLDDALQSAQRAVDIAPTNHKAYQALAWVRYFRKEFPASRKAAERTIALNPMDGAALVYVGQTIAFTGDWERGCSLILHATELNPNHAGWYWYTPFLNAYRKNDYSGALDYALKINMPGFPLACIALAVAYGQLGQGGEAQRALRELLTLRPDYASLARSELRKIWDDQLVEHLIDGLRKAGLDIVDDSTKPPPASSVATATRTGSSAAHASVREDEGFWVAVLPFRYSGDSADLKALAEGLSEEVITGLSRFSYLRVIARGSTAKYLSESGDVRAIGKELGARYVMEGSLRQAGSAIRLAVRLVDATTCTHLWAETFEHPFHPNQIFALQDQLVPRIVSTVADAHGILTRSISAAIRKKSDDQLSPYEAVFRVFSLHEQITANDHATCRDLLERTVKDTPDAADCWAMLATLYGDEDWLGLNPRPGSLVREAAAAQRAVELAPAGALANHALAQSLFQRHEWQAFKPVAERTIALNPLGGASMAFLGALLACTGEWEKGCAVADSAMKLQPNFAGYYWLARVLNAYRTRDYRTAIDTALRIQMPGFFWAPVALTAAYGQLDEREAAQKSLRELLVLRPNFAATARQELEKWLDPQLAEHFMDGLRKAGLETAHVAMATTPSSGSIADATASGAARGDEGFWVAVLPFKHPDSNTDLRTLAEGLSEEVITGLSRFSYLRVIARGSTAKYSSEAGDVRAIGKEVGARYVMEGSIRQAGATLRISAQLVDAFTGAHLWAESYERAFRTENIFALQDDLVPRIVSTVADAHGVLHRAMTQAVSNKNLEELTPYEALLRTLTYVERLGPEEHAVARACAERAVQLAPNYSQAWAVLAQVYAGEYGHFLNPRPQPLERALKAAQRAVDLDPSNSGAHCALAFVLFFRKQFQAFRIAAEQALELNPYAAGEAVVLGLCIAYSGDWQRGCAVVDRAMQINPRLPGWSRFPAFYNAYRNRDYAGAIRIGLKFNLPNLSSAHAAMAAAYAQVGDLPAAQKELQELHRLMPNTADVLERIRRWHLPEMAGHLIDGLHTAGLEIPEVKKEDPKQTSSGPVPFSQSIAVLPFANMSDDREQDYFSDGLAEEIINLLAQIPALKVIARTSAFAFRGKEQDIRGIAEALGVNTVLEGSVRRSGSRIRVTAQLINATDGSHLWSERYDRELRDIFAVQDEISAAIAKALRVRLTRESATQRYTPKLEAYEAYLKGRYHQAKVTPESMDLARRFYEQASELDPAFAMPHVGLAFYWHCLAHFGRHFARDCVSPARAEARQALQIDPSLPEAHAFLGYIAAMYDLDWAAAETHFDSPGAKEVGFGLLRPLYAWVQFWEGKVEPAIRLAERAIEEDPLEVWTRMNLHAYLQAAGRHDDALEQLKKVLELDENLVLALVSMAMIYADKGNMAEALKIARRAFAIGPWSPDPIGVLAGLTRRNGDEVEASLMKALGSGEMPGDARAHALYHLLCGEIDQGSDWAEKAIVQRDASMMVYLRFVVCRSLRASHRWPTIAKMVNLPA